jgi:hypothetical protein
MERSKQAAEVLGRLHELGAINLDVLIGDADKVTGVLGGFDWDDDDHGICYPFYIHIGPHFVDLVSVADQVKQLGFNISRGG